MAVSIRGPVGSNSGNAGSSSGGSLTIPADARTGEMALLVIECSNTAANTALDVTTTGWTRVGSQTNHASQSATLFTRTLPGTSGAVSTEAGTSVTLTLSPNAVRWSAELVVVANAGTPEVATFVNEGDNNTTFSLPTMTPTFNDAFLLWLVGGSLGATTTPSITVTTGSATERGHSYTTNTTNRVEATWIGTNQRSGGAGVATTARTLTTGTGMNATGWMYAFPASATAAVATYTRTNKVSIDTAGSVGTMTLTQTDSTGETATITGPSSGVFTVTLPATHTQTLTFDLVATNGAVTDTETIAISPMGSSSAAAGPKVRFSGAWV